MGIAIAIMCHKGGTGKTTTVNSLAGYFSLSGLKTLIIDADEQANIKTLFSLRLSNSDGGLASILIEKLMPEAMIQKTAFENIEVILSGGRRMKDFEEVAFQDKRCLTRMSELLSHLKTKYDIILIDTPPAIGAISVNVVEFSDYVLLVSEPDLLGLMGTKATELFITNEVAQKLKLKTAKILGVAFTRFDIRRSADHNAMDEMDTYAAKGNLDGGKVFDPIRQDAKLRTAQSRRRTIFHYAPKSNSAQDYQKLATDILTEVELKKDNTKALEPNEVSL